MYNNENEYPQNFDRDRVQWNGSTYSSRTYRMEDLDRPVAPTGAGSGPSPAAPQKKRGGARRAVALVLCCALVGGASGVGGAALFQALSGDDGASSSGSTVIYQNGTPASSVTVTEVDGVTAMSLPEIYAAYSGSCVAVNCTVTYTTNTWFGPQSQTASSAGSGFVITENGYIVTNYHVIDGADSISVAFTDGSEYAATYVGGEESADVAVLKIDAEGLTPVVLGDSDTLLVGETVSTIGNALGALSFSQSSGIVSGLSRTVTYSDGTIINMLQTDCTINSGNSGGPLFDSYGRVVGITSAKYSNNGDSSDAAIENIGFAIPINDVKDIITDIMEHGYVVRPYMGITVATVTEEYAAYFGWPQGAYVNSVEEGSCAEAAGLRKGDIITVLGESLITSATELTAAKNSYQVGDTVELTVYRSGEYLTLTITFDASQDPTGTTESGSESSGNSGMSGFGH